MDSQHTIYNILIVGELNNSPTILFQMCNMHTQISTKVLLYINSNNKLLGKVVPSFPQFLLLIVKDKNKFPSIGGTTHCGVIRVNA